MNTKPTMRTSAAAAMMLLAIGLPAATGIAIATTTTSPITLCLAKGGAVVAPGSNGQCGKGQTAISLASGADLQTLANRVDRDENLIALNQTTSLQASATDTFEEKVIDVGAYKVGIACEIQSGVVTDYLDIQKIDGSAFSVQGMRQTGNEFQYSFVQSNSITTAAIDESGHSLNVTANHSRDPDGCWIVSTVSASG
jgi:hypothetical protein